MCLQRLPVASRPGLPLTQEVTLHQAIGSTQFKNRESGGVGDQEPPGHPGPIPNLNLEFKPKSLVALARPILCRHRFGDTFGGGHGPHDGEGAQQPNRRKPGRRTLHPVRPVSLVGPAYAALAPSSASMRNSWLYLQTRSVRQSDPVLI